jgi:mannosyltransferase
VATTVDTEPSSAAVVESTTAAVAVPLTERLDRVLRYAVPVATGLVVVGVILRFVAHSQLWLDEALTVNIARLPIGKIPGALRHDGAPPLYYVLLHFWMVAFGEGNVAVRALSGLASVASLPLVWIAGRRLGGRRLAWASLLLMASSPFAISYATSARMYSFMILWSLLGVLALARALEQPTTSRLACLGALTAIVLYTHYWGLYLVAITGLWLLVQVKRRRPSPAKVAATAVTVDDKALPEGASEDPAEAARRAAWSCFVAMVLGSLAFLPWLPSFLFQTLHTGTPWSNAAGLGDILTVLGQYAGGGPWGAALALSLFTLVLLGVFGESIDGHRVLVSLNARRKARPIAFMFMGTLMLAVACGAVAQAAFVGRYTAAVFPLFILLAGLGAAVFVDRRVLAAVLAWTAAAGLIVAIGPQLSPRTQAGQVASVINKEASPNDVVVYCPDQLGPAASRLITVTVQQFTFPRGDSPLRINWVDYRQAIANTNVQQFAQQMLRVAAGHDIWFVQNPNYAGTQHKCSQLMNWLSANRNSQVWVADRPGISLENESLTRFLW